MAIKKIGRATLNLWLKEIIEQNYVVNSESDNEEGCHSYTFIKDEKEYTLTVYLKNISSAYLSYAPSVMRIQVPRLESITPTKKDNCFFICGITTVNDKHMLVVWNPQEYKYHKSFRSAYVYYENIMKAYEEGYCTTVDHEVRIYACKPGYFNRLLDQYIENTYFEEISW